VEHATIIVKRPEDQVRPICTCGWQGTTCRNAADARIEADEHIAEGLKLE
jgi:hypothetical protein